MAGGWCEKTITRKLQYGQLGDLRGWVDPGNCESIPLDAFSGRKAVNLTPDPRADTTPQSELGLSKIVRSQRITGAPIAARHASAPVASFELRALRDETNPRNLESVRQNCRVRSSASRRKGSNPANTSGGTEFVHATL